MMILNSIENNNDDDDGDMKLKTKVKARRGMGSLKVNLLLSCFYLLCNASGFADAFVAPSRVARSGAIDGCCARYRTAGFKPCAPCTPATLSLFGNDGDDSDGGMATESKFDNAQRIESLKSVVLGALSGGIAVTPIAYLHYVFASEIANTAQWEFTTDMSSLQAALFAIVYRYAVRANDNNPMLNQGVVGAFVVVRTLANIQVTDTCLSVPLRCGPPLGYFDWNMIQQAAWGGAESVALFGATSLAMEFAFRQNWISKFD